MVDYCALVSTTATCASGETKSFQSRLVCDLKPGCITEAEENILHLSVKFQLLLFPVFLLAEVSCSWSLVTGDSEILLGSMWAT